MLDWKKYTAQHIATVVAILFHAIGLWGIVYSGKPAFFISTTPLHLLLMTGLLMWTHTKKTAQFWILFILICALGFSAEWIGVHTTYLFGHYSYGKGLGWNWMGIPLIIGVNWWMTVYGSGQVMQRLWKYLSQKSSSPAPAWMITVSFIIDGAALATLFDWVMEPVAIRLDYWSWYEQTTPPGYNYLCWFLLSVCMLSLLKPSINKQPNPFAVNLLMIQLTYFSLLRLLL